MVRYLIGKYSDPVFGMVTGAFAYYLWEKDPKNAAERPPGRSLHELASRRWQNGQAPLSLAPVTSR
ncbi:hypothetical protein K437DRAFT_266617 [Tilletiaria anomala UBC 951]|uniref:Non-classical export protein 1 n=1 Tax=Tilletiaria anomala (strain ATCC 24038 / CBS 436.72 / UBC 951) TaxID=1037660 RepID=A0A066WN72_TILAU|nr:uncharacterized protein K437DRAFT_266617 [Tilletiaria anomala UBC 951]KDN52429.1 hypothetical protein K437DRAFT_266617 [Tilletiaria anomala UBC 951]